MLLLWLWLLRSAAAASCFDAARSCTLALPPLPPPAIIAAGSTYNYCYKGCHMPWLIANKHAHNLGAYAGVVGVRRSFALGLSTVAPLPFPCPLHRPSTVTFLWPSTAFSRRDGNKVQPPTLESPLEACIMARICARGELRNAESSRLAKFTGRAQPK